MGVAIGVWSYFGITEQLNRHSTELKLMSSDLEKKIQNLELSGFLVEKWEVCL